MKFYAIYYKYQSEVFFNFAKESDELGLDSTSFLPTRDMAEQYIENELTDHYGVVEVEVTRITRDGTIEWILGSTPEWDEGY